MWTYRQATGEWLDDQGQVVTVGYSGHGEGKNNALLQQIPNVGPIPRGRYTIGAAFDHPEKGPLVMPLTPDPTDDMFGRSGFLIHGDLIGNPGQASEGCIILSRTTRALLANSPDRRVEVV